MKTGEMKVLPDNVYNVFKINCDILHRSNKNTLISDYIEHKDNNVIINIEEYKSNFIFNDYSDNFIVSFVTSHDKGYLFYNDKENKKYVLYNVTDNFIFSTSDLYYMICMLYKLSDVYKIEYLVIRIKL